MRPLENNLASNPYRNEKMLTLFFVAVTVLTIAFTVHNVHGFVTADARSTALRESLSQHKHEMRQIEAKARTIREALAKIDDDTLASQWDFVQSIQAQRDIAWTRLFNWLEEVIPWNVRLNTIRPGTRGKRVQITITGVAKNLEAYVDCQGVIEESIPFSEVDPGSWSKKQSGNEVNFTMSFIYEDPALVRKDPTQIAADAEKSEGEEKTDEVWVVQGDDEAGEHEDAEPSVAAKTAPADSPAHHAPEDSTFAAQATDAPAGARRNTDDGGARVGGGSASKAPGGRKADRRTPTGGRGKTNASAAPSTGFLPGAAAGANVPTIGGGRAADGAGSPKSAGERTIRRHAKPKEVEEMDLTRPRTLLTLPDAEDPSSRVATGEDGEPIIKLDSVPRKQTKKESGEASEGEASGGDSEQGDSSEGESGGSDGGESSAGGGDNG